MTPYTSPPAIVETIEINHVYNDNGDKMFSQLILWDWYPQDSSYHVRDWSFMDKVSINGAVAYLFYKGEVQQVRGRNIIKTWTQYDREVKDREELPDSKRMKVIRR